MKKFGYMIKGDIVIWIAVIFIAFTGLVEVYSCTAMISYKFQDGNTFYYPFRHLGYLVMGFVAMFIFSLVPYKTLAKYADWLLWISVGLLALTLLTGQATNDAKRWFTIPFIGISFQPSDFAKLALMLYLSKMLALAQVDNENRRQYFFKCLAAILLVCMLVLPANFSTCALIGAASLGMLILGSFPRKWIWTLIAGGVILFLVFVLVVKATGMHSRLDTWISRVETYFTADDGDKLNSDFQSEQSLVAIGLGGLSGVGIGSGTQNNSVPHPYSDFIFASLAHEMGIAGVIWVLFLYLVLFYRCVSVVKDVDTLFPALLVMGFTMNIMLQTIANIFVAVGFFPVTGQPLPFMSMGGSSIISTGTAIGVILNISRYAGKREPVSEIEQDEPVTEEIVDYPFMVG